MRMGDVAVNPDFPRRQIIVAVAVVVGIAILGSVVYAARLGVQRIAEGEDSRSVAGALARLLGVSTAAGVLSWAVTEFLKRMTPVNELFLASAVRKFERGRSAFVIIAEHADLKHLSSNITAVLTEPNVTTSGSIRQATA